MKLSSASVVALLLPAASARFIEPGENEHVALYTDWAKDDAVASGSEAAAKFLIELAPGETRWVTEEQKWKLRREGKNFFDITDNSDFESVVRPRAATVFPHKPVLQKAIKPLLANLSKTEMEQNLGNFTSFHTRYYKSNYGRQSSDWLLKKVRDMIAKAGAEDYVTAEPFEHAAFPQRSIVARIPGKTNKTICIGAHQDSINLWLPSIMAAPGADDDGSGTVTILEALRALLSNRDIVEGNHENTLEFHWYAAEEGGLLGSQDLFKAYAKQGKVVKAMLQQDMTGFVDRTLKAGKVESVGIVTDFVSPELTDFIKKIIVQYCDIPFVETKCGYACSDHASASKAGYPSAFVIESAFEYSDNHIHTTDDLIKYLSFDHMLQHCKMTTAFAYELAHADFDALEAAHQEI